MDEQSKSQNALSGFVAAAGVILAISYPVLAISTGFRAIFQIAEGDPANSPWLTLLGALLYTLATVGFAKQPRPLAEERRNRLGRLGSYWRAITPREAWNISVTVLLIETAFTLIIGTLSFTHPDLFGRNVWQYFGRDYGYFPLIQPLLGMLWLFEPSIRRAYRGA